MKRNKSLKNRAMIAAAIILLCVAGVLLWQVISREYQIRKARADNSSLRDYVMKDPDHDFGEYANNEAYQGGGDTAGDTGAGPYVSPLDWDKLWKENEDACGWLEIPESDMSFPIVLHPGDNNYYLNKNFKKENSIYGAAYMEDYNKQDFSDICSVVYGHDISNGEWFGELQTIFTDSGRFDKCRDMVLYLPEEERVYRVFAAVPYGTKHILASYDLNKENVYKSFLEEITGTRALNAVIDRDEIPEPGTRLLILSTCLKGDYSHRFLVLAYERR